MRASTSPGSDHQDQAAKVLGLAQQIADQLTREAKAEADGMLRTARTTSSRLWATETLSMVWYFVTAT